MPRHSAFIPVLHVLLAAAACEALLAMFAPALGAHGIWHGVVHTLALTLAVTPVAWWHATVPLRQARGQIASNSRAQAERDSHHLAHVRFLSRLGAVEQVTEAADVTLDALQAEARRSGVHDPRSALLVYGHDGICRFVASRGLSQTYQQAVSGHCPWKEGDRAAEPILVSDPDDPSCAPFRAVLAAEGIGSLAFIPLCTDRGVIGKVMLYSRQPHGISRAALDAARDVAGCAGVALGRILAARRLERVAALLATTGTMARIGGWELDLASGNVTWSDEVYRIHEVPQTERVSVERAIEFYAPEARERISAAIRVATQDGSGWDLELPLVTAKGRRIWVRAQGEAEVIAGRVVRLRGAFQDISERRSAQERMARSMRDLLAARNESRRQAAELAARAAEMEALRNAAEAASHAKSEFLANMSHEIRTPLTAILGYADVLGEEEAASPERRGEVVEIIRAAGQHLLTVLNDILDLSKIEAGRMTVEAVETRLPDIFAEVHRLMLPRAQAKGVRLLTTFDTPIPDLALLDPTRLRQILLNIVGNATKFTDAGEVSVHASLQPATADAPTPRLVVDVHDSGPGISLEQRSRLFASFSQADPSVTRRHGGSGLGLIICRRLALLMGGDVTLTRSEPGQGSSFRIDIPILPAAHATLVAALPLAPSSDSRASDIRLPARILFAEDGIDNQRLIAMHLRRAGAEVTLAPHGRAAHQAILHARAQNRPFQLILTDMQMPEMDGYTLARTLRAAGDDTPIIALTAHAMAEDRDRCLAAGCDDFASKPIDKAALLATCAAWLGRRSPAALPPESPAAAAA